MTPEITPTLAEELAHALTAHGPDYVPRTRHKNADGTPKYTNRLVRETSPYLLQHAHNPVNWFPWGDEAFELARVTGRPIFLSVGYSTCHWCHVMEEESFEDEEVAEYLNAHYIPIKVDREERPDVDSIYMTAVQALTGRGGWPMSVWLTATREPFFGGTYFPARDGDRGTRKGFLSLLAEQAKLHRETPEAILTEAGKLAERVRRTNAPAPAGGTVTPQVLETARSVATRLYDATNGGARGAPKFPSSFPVRGLLRDHHRSGRADSLEMALATLRKMAAGGMYDHVGGGFHRYSTDQKWLVPHFEKMLYDNALLSVAYLEGYQASGDADLARVARETLDYVAREMTDPAGGFYSATDADSLTPSGHREEGYFFTWTPQELSAALDADAVKLVTSHYAVRPGGNFEGRSILHTPRPRDSSARELGLNVDAFSTRVDAARETLRRVRATRKAPLRDDKIQVSWNGLMIGAFARGARVLDEPRYAKVAQGAARYLLDRMRPAGRLHHSSMNGKVATLAFLEDYAFLAAGLLDLFETTQDPSTLREALSLMDALEEHHADRAHGGYFLTAHDQEKLLAREKPDYDGAVPAGNSIALLTLLRLSEFTTDDKWRARAETTLRAFSTQLTARPGALDEMLLGVDFYLSRPKEIVIVLPTGADTASARPLASAVHRTFVPNSVLVMATEAELGGELGKLVPWAQGKPAKDGKATAYVCERGACELPTADPLVLARQLAALRG